MNIRSFSMALLVSALPLLVLAESTAISLNAGDFVSAERISREGDTVVSLKLSKSGKAKLKKLNKTALGQAVHADIGGVQSDFRLREAITGEGLEMGPYTAADAEKVVTRIHGK